MIQELIQELIQTFTQSVYCYITSTSDLQPSTAILNRLPGHSFHTYQNHRSTLVLSIPCSHTLKDFAGVCTCISNTFHRVHLVYTPSHRVLIHLKGYLTFASSHKLLICVHQKQTDNASQPLQLQASGNIKSTTPLWDRRQLNPTCTHRILYAYQKL